jgi:hypothetical protein
MSAEVWGCDKSLDWLGLAVLNALNHDSKCESFGFGRCFTSRSAVAKIPRKLRHFGNPSSVDLLLAFYCEVHG